MGSGTSSRGGPSSSIVGVMSEKRISILILTYYIVIVGLLLFVVVDHFLPHRAPEVLVSDCGVNYRLAWKGNNWVCQEYPPRYGEIGNPMLEDPNCRLVRKSSQGDLYRC